MKLFTKTKYHLVSAAVVPLPYSKSLSLVVLEFILNICICALRGLINNTTPWLTYWDGDE